MGIRNYLIEGDPKTCTRTVGVTHEHHIWHLDKVKALDCQPGDILEYKSDEETQSTDEFDIFLDPNITRQPRIDS